MVHMPSLPMMVIIAVIGLLLFGKRLPEVGKSLGKGIVEFKKGLKGIEEEVSAANDASTAKSKVLPDQKFDPYTGKSLDAPKYKFDPETGKPLDHVEVADATHETVDSH